MSPPNEPSPSEWRILRVVTERAPCAARDVVEEASAAWGWSPSTIKTLLRRLVEKGHVRTRRVGNSFVYRPTRSALRTLRQAADALLERASEGTVGPLIAYLVKKSSLSRQELDDLRALLNDLDQPGEEKTP